MSTYLVTCNNCGYCHEIQESECEIDGHRVYGEFDRTYVRSHGIESWSDVWAPVLAYVSACGQCGRRYEPRNTCETCKHWYLSDMRRESIYPMTDEAKKMKACTKKYAGSHGFGVDYLYTFPDDWCDGYEVKR